MTTVNFSEQQLNVFAALKNPSIKNLMIEAVAGSGKTFTLLEILKRLPSSVQVAFCAFSKNISVEITSKVDAINDLLCVPKVGTTHSFGFSAVKKVYPKTKVDDKKIDLLMDEVVNGKSGEKGVPLELRSFVRKAYKLARQWGVNVLDEFKYNNGASWLKLVDHFELEDELVRDEEEKQFVNVDELVRQGVNWTVYCLKLGIDLCETIIDFEDMIWIPLVKEIKMWQYDVVLVDECQDINPTRRCLVRKMLKVGGRAIFVGDPRQAIFGFTGADSESIPNIVREFGCTTLPLTFSFRCPKAVVNFAQTWVSHIESTPDAPMGKVEQITEASFLQMDIDVKDAILCRNNAPLIDLFFRFLRNGVACHIEGREIAEELIKTVNRFPKIKNIPLLIEKLEEWKEQQIQKWNAKGKEERAERIADTVDAICAVASNVSANAPVSELKDKITSMFRDGDGNKAPTVTLTTIHKAKGREWDRVFWYGRNRWNPSKYARKDWQVVAEDNLCYVAATRSKSELYDVYVPAKKKDS